MTSTPGRRQPDGHAFQARLGPGDYMRDLFGIWWARPPRGHMAMLDTHAVTEHEDRTISVTPSIVATEPEPNTGRELEVWHGWLERGVWREV